MYRKYYLIAILLAFSLTSIAQTTDSSSFNEMSPKVLSPMDARDVKPFSHLQIGANVGSTGIGIEVTTPLSKNVRVRAGFNLMPKISLSKDYSMTVEGDGTTEMTQTRVEHLCECLSDLVQTKVDGYVEMFHDVNFYNCRLLADWYPFKKKHWHFTGGLYIGPKSVGKAINVNTDCITMVAVNMYNQMYDMCASLGEFEYPYFKFGNHTYELDPISGQYMKDAFKLYGRATIKLGEFPDGTPHYVYPNERGIMQADAETWSIKPYVGFGWSTNFGYDKRWMISIEGGVLYWGRPHVYCNDGIDLVNDVNNIGGNVGDYIRILKHMPIFPNLEIRVAYTFF